MKIKNKRIAAATTALVVASFLFVYGLFWIIPNVVGSWNASLVDRLFQYRSSSKTFHPPYDTAVVHVDITDRTIKELKGSYLNRGDYAAVTRNLADMKIAAQVWDFIFPARMNPTEDSLFADAAGYAKNMYVGTAFRSSGEADTGVVPENIQYLKGTKWNVKVEGDAGDYYYGYNPSVSFSELAKRLKGMGYLNMEPDPDGSQRRIALLIHYDGAFFPSIAFCVACEYLNVPPENIVVRPGSIVLTGAHRPGAEAHDITIPVDRHGNMIVSYIGPWESLQHYNFVTVWNLTDNEDEKELMGDELSGKIVIVDEITTGSSDHGPVPTDENLPLGGVHSNAINTILEEDFLTEISEPIMLGIEIILMGILLWLSLRFSSLTISVGMIALLLVYLAGAGLLFLYGHFILNILRPSLMIVTSLCVVVGYRYFNEEKEKEVLRRSFEAYFPPSVVKQIMANPDMITSAGQKKELSILFSDIKGFTTHSAKLKPDQVRQMLNEYFDAMIGIVFEHGGTVDKFMGDGLMVFFGDPESQPDHALRCVRAAIAMQIKVREIRERWVAEGKFPLQIRIGINTGQVIVGNMGSARRLSYTALGANVNLAQRLESNAPVDGILVSQATYEKVKDEVQSRSLGEIQVKGLEQPVPVFEVLVTA
jgi:adenylate cyclase